MKKNKLMKTIALWCLATTLALPLPLTAKADNNNYSIPTGYTAADLVWSDEFSGTSLDTDSWNYEIGNNNGWGNAEQQYYTKSENNVFIADISSDTESGSLDGKALAIKAMSDNSINDYRFTSGRITTSGKHSFKYGRVEAKIKMENGMNRGVWPAFWMLGYTPGTGWPYCGEIDIMEHANANNYISGTLHWADETLIGDQHKYQGGSKSYSSGNMDTWHTYAIEWDSTQIVWYLDDVAYYRLPMTSTMSEIVNNEFYIILNVAIGGNYIGGPHVVPNTLTWSSSTMYVDYVRIYQKSAGSSVSGTWNKAPIWQNYEESTTPSTICNVKFMDGNNVYLSGTLTKGQYLNYVNMEKAGYTFLGWYTTDGTKFDFNKQVYEDELTLYSKWELTTTAAPDKATTPVTVKRPSITSIKSKSKRKVTLRFKSKDKAIGFQIKYGTNKKLTKKVKTKSTKKKTISIIKLKSKTTYYFKVREYKLSNGKRIYSKWSSVKKVKVK